MAYHQDNQYLGHHKKSYRGFRYAILVLILAALVFGFKKVFRNFSYAITVPVIETSTAFERGIYSTAHSKSKLLQRIDSLEAENETLRSKMIDYSLIENENSGFKNSVLAKSDSVLASVIGKPSLSAYDTLLVSVPEGIQIGKRVYTISGIPLGSVSSVSGRDATITLYSSPGIETNSEIILEDAMNSISAVFRGRGGASFEAIISKDVEIPVGSLATVPSLFSEPFAEVVKTVSRDDTKDQVVYLRSVVNFQYLRFVVIEK